MVQTRLDRDMDLKFFVIQEIGFTGVKAVFYTEFSQQLTPNFTTQKVESHRVVTIISLEMASNIIPLRGM